MLDMSSVRFAAESIDSSACFATLGATVKKTQQAHVS